MMPPIKSSPLILDLDGTLIATDLLAETMLLFVRSNPLRLFVALAWLLKGRAYLKRRLAEATDIAFDLLPVRADVEAFAREQAQAGRAVYIATAADAILAGRLETRFDFVEAVIGSDGGVNLKGRQKAAALAARFPEGFAYVGDAAADLPVWASANEAAFAGRSARVRRLLQRLHRNVTLLKPSRPRARDWIKALRLHQWTKNALIFVPLALGGALKSSSAWIACGLGFLALGCLASGSYLLNDLVDLQDDRRHWNKRNRAFASGLIPIALGVALVPVGLAVGLGLAWAAKGAAAAGMTGLYLAVTLFYSFRLKRVPILDAVVLAGLFTIRLAMGVVCAEVRWSPWLLVFSMFVFGSLSLAKRFAEITRVKALGDEQVSGRGYLVADAPMVMGLGLSLASAAVLVMVMYLIEEAFREGFYRTPGLLWVAPIILALWLGRIWLLCGRGLLNDDPVAFAVRDRISLALGGLLTLSALAAVLL